MPPKKRSCGKEEEKVSEHYMEPEESMGSKEDVAPERGMGAEKLLEIRNLVKDYGVKGFQSRVLKGIDLTVFKDDFLAIIGPSGSPTRSCPGSGGIRSALSFRTITCWTP